MNCFCRRKKTINTGSIVSVEPAIKRDQSTDVEVLNKPRPTGRVRIPGLVEAISGQSKLFQAVVKENIPTVASAGRWIGSTIRQNVRSAELPSTFAASKISSGTDNIN